MSSSITKYFLIVPLLFFLFTMNACAEELGHDVVNCVEKSLKAKVVRVDEQNKRLFVVHPTLTSEEFNANLAGIKACIGGKAWGDDWAISVFTDQKYAGYKDEKSIIPFHKDNAWAKAYRFEYSNSESKLLKSPALKGM